MALVDTQGFVMAVDRSLFGPQGRRWIERKLPEVATNIAFVAVSAFGASLLVFHVCQDFSVRGYWAILQAPKYLVNAIFVHLVARGLRWHIDRMLGRSFLQEDEALPDFLGGTRWGGDGDGDRVLWPWQSFSNKERTTSADSMESNSDRGLDRSRGIDGVAGIGNSLHRTSKSAENVNLVPSDTRASQEGDGGQGGERENPLLAAGAAAAASAVADGPNADMRVLLDDVHPSDRSRKNSNDHHLETSSQKGNDKQRAHGRRNGQDRGGGPGFPDLFAACRPHSHSNSPDPSPIRTTEPPSSDPSRRHRHRCLPFGNTGDSVGPGGAPSPAGPGVLPGESDDDKEVVNGALSPNSRIRAVRNGGERREADEEGRGGSVEGKSVGSVSDDGGAGGHGAGSRGSRRRFQALTLNTTAGTKDGEWQRVRRQRRGEGGVGQKEEKRGASLVGRTKTTGGDRGHRLEGISMATTLTKRPPPKSGGSWRSIDTISRALHVGSSSRRHAQRLVGGDRASEHHQLNFFTESDLDDLLHSTFFIKMCDDASWLYVEDHPHQPEWNWLLPLWGGYRIAPKFQGEVKKHEAHRMLFQCETGRHKDHVRIRSRATNTFLFFLGVKQPLTWVAWDRDVVGGDWEDVKLEWVGKPTGPDGVLMGDERGRVIIRSRPMNGYVSWNGSRFSHVPSREGAAVFTFQRMAPSLGIGGSGALRRGVTGSGREPSIREKY